MVVKVRSQAGLLGTVYVGKCVRRGIVNVWNP